ncbi:hypothetical protein ACH4SP_23330 [Streptomyces sp. NPDC021093]|uniref:hypothetical protein n=1 Tax=Streptomyces sp. NPDC021093 TaxID=3365112 RepID=UPI0037A39519
MTQNVVPPQPQPRPPPSGRPPVDPAASEACRLLCAGSYLDGEYRDAVIEELYVHEERLAAPSYGIDATRVLAHALRARRSELAWALGMLAMWAVSVPLTGGLFLFVLFPCLVLAVAGWIRGRSANPPWFRLVAAFLVRLYGRISLAFVLFGLLLVAFSSSGTGSSVLDWLLPDALSAAVAVASVTSGVAGQAWFTLGLFALIVAGVGLQRGQFARVLAHELSVRQFPHRNQDPAETLDGVRFERLRDRIRTEQYSPLIMYRSGDPFCGAGLPVRPWALAVELKPRPDRKEPPEPITNTEVLRRITPLLEALRIPSGDPVRAAGVRDRLRELQLDECVFLPVTGLPRRELAPYGAGGFERHRANAVEEGGETRRHFLRIRVGGWSEEVVTTVFVRVHTQGGMLMLEVAPHVLLPVRPLFQAADRLAHQYRHNSWFGKAAYALAHTPSSPGRAAATLVRGVVSTWKLLTGGYGGALPDGPARAVRELGSDVDASLFQEMDFSRYLKSVEDRVAGGVKAALHDAGWQTEEFVQQVNQVFNQMNNFGTVNNSAFSQGDYNTVRNQGGGSHGAATGAG